MIQPTDCPKPGCGHAWHEGPCSEYKEVIPDHDPLDQNEPDQQPIQVHCRCPGSG